VPIAVVAGAKILAVADQDDSVDIKAAGWHPLADDDRVLAAGLVARFLERLVAEMSPTECAYTADWSPPRLEIGISPRGDRLLAIVFGGSRTVMGWDGTTADAQQIIDDCAEASATNSESDFWMHGGGWKEWRSDDSPMS